MSNFNFLLKSHFKGCEQLGVILDPHRDREIKIYKLPDQHDLVGYFDGVDAWLVSFKHAQVKMHMQPVRKRLTVEVAPAVNTPIPRRTLIIRKTLNG